MTPRERLLGFLSGTGHDRTPNLTITMQFASRLLGVPYLDYATRAEVQAAGQVRVAREFGIDHVSAISDPAVESHDCGAQVVFAPDSPPANDEVNALLADPARLFTLKVPDPHRPGSRMANRLEVIRLLRRQAGSTHAVEGWIEGPVAESADLRGINTLMMDYYDDPDFVRRLADFVVEMELRFAAAQVEAGADIIGLGDAAASLLSRDLYDGFAWPWEKRLVDGVHALGAKVRLHVCGNTQHLADAFARLGADVVDLDYPVDPTAARAAAGPSQVFAGNIHPVEVVRNGTPAGVEAALERCRAALGPRWIASAGCEVPRDTPRENVAAIGGFCARAG